jgi:hypothetical protein
MIIARPRSGADCQMDRFVQVIDLHTSHRSEVERLLDTWRATGLKPEHVQRATVARDADDDGHLVLQLEFGNAAASVAGPDAGGQPEYAAQLVALLDRPPHFRGTANR